MAELLEWFQCKKCGRRQRWRAELAGRTVDCACGARVTVPDPELRIDSADPEDTLSATGSAIAMDQTIGMDESSGAPVIPAAYSYGAAQRGIFGLTPFGELILWTILAAIGFVLAVFAAFNYKWTAGWICGGIALIWAPVSLYKWRRAERRWQGYRKLARAVEETLDTDQVRLRAVSVRKPRDG